MQWPGALGGVPPPRLAGRPTPPGDELAGPGPTHAPPTARGVSALTLEDEGSMTPARIGSPQAEGSDQRERGTGRDPVRERG